MQLVTLGRWRVVVKIYKEPMQFPESSFGGVQPPRQEPGFERLRFQNHKLHLHEWFLRMPSVASPIHPNKKQSFELVFHSPLTRLQPLHLSPHPFTSPPFTYTLALCTNTSLS